ncbi:MAG: hypothetical protein PF495_13830 [Spirochaetales bacterium]|jgi:hypothetical protein|nr:hypothetical protein [Spirochaetales bacterium]
MKKFYTAALAALLIAGTGCKEERKTRAFMSGLGCFRDETATTQYYVPGMTNKTIAEAIKYCMEYSIIGATDSSGKFALYSSETICTTTQLKNDSFVNILQKNVNQPGFWAIESWKGKSHVQEKQEGYIDSIRRAGFIECTYDLDKKTVTIRYRDSQQRKMNFEHLISLMGLAVDNRPAAG